MNHERIDFLIESLPTRDELADLRDEGQDADLIQILDLQESTLEELELLSGHARLSGASRERIHKLISLRSVWDYDLRRELDLY
jgi:hypothetical protein